MENTNRYMMSTIEEYFELMDKQTEKNSKLIAKSLVKYLKGDKKTSKYDELKKTAQI